MLGLERGQVDDRGLAGRICQACVDGLGIDGASISLLTASDARQTLCATDPVAELLEDLRTRPPSQRHHDRRGSTLIMPDAPDR